MKKKKSKGLLWVILICIVALAGFYYRRQVTSRLADYVATARSLAPSSDRHPSQETKNTKALTANANETHVHVHAGRKEPLWMANNVS